MIKPQQIVSADQRLQKYGKIKEVYLEKQADQKIKGSQDMYFRLGKQGNFAYRYLTNTFQSVVSLLF